MPVHDLEDTGELEALHELMEGGFQHPQLAVVVDDDLLSVAVIPETEHDVDESLNHHLLRDHDGSGHADVVIGMAAVVERRRGDVDLVPALGRVATDRLADLSNHEVVETAVGVVAVVLRRSDGDEHNVVLASLFVLNRPRRGLNVASALSEL